MTEAAASAPVPVWIGTSGFSFPDWVGVFYPEGLPKPDWLPFYAGRFSVLEVNSTYYHLPSPGMIERMCDRTPEGFGFVVKANQKTTHEHADADVAARFRDALAPLVERGRLRGVLAQFPWGFRNTPENRDYLLEMAGRTADVPWFIEFRHRGWIVPEVGDLLREHGLGFVSVDEPQLSGMVPPVAKATTSTGYVRFHGRNAAAWWGKGPDAGHERYNYLYSPEELQAWADKIDRLAQDVREVLIFFNNCSNGHSVTNAQMMRDILSGAKNLAVR